MDKPIVAIVGRPNVGKSTLFNRLSSTRQAIIHPTPGVTRDRNYIDVSWSGIDFVLIDTGGIEVNSNDPLLQQIRHQAEVAIKEADVIVFLCDGKDGVAAADVEISHILHKTSQPVILAINKVDNMMRDVEFTSEFYRLGMGNPIALSSIHGLNINDLLDEIISHFEDTKRDASSTKDTKRDASSTIAIAVVGKPNVGKSSLINVLLGEERLIVHDVAGTTRDTIDTNITWNGQELVLIDTAGIRKKAKIKEDIEKSSVLRALNAVDRSKVSVLMIDCNEGLTEQDQKILSRIEHRGCGCIIAVNKWDLRPSEEETEELREKYAAFIQKQIPYLVYVKVVFISALKKQGITRLLNLVEKTAQEHGRWISTGRVNRAIEKACEDVHPPSTNGKQLKIFYATQVKTNPPIFALFVNQTALVTDAYSRYLMKKLREGFGFEGVPVKFAIKQR
ncbi:ribosome biogenesis GTPase Der [Candidatus Desantisbacteria bacterium]|nr:ribosome biogenesis GTPase Der [Candidatus Desantisbacteria bacterium]